MTNNVLSLVPPDKLCGFLVFSELWKKMPSLKSVRRRVEILLLLWSLARKHSHWDGKVFPPCIL